MAKFQITCNVYHQVVTEVEATSEGLAMLKLQEELRESGYEIMSYVSVKRIKEAIAELEI